MFISTWASQYVRKIFDFLHWWPFTERNWTRHLCRKHVVSKYLMEKAYVTICGRKRTNVSSLKMKKGEKSLSSNLEVTDNEPNWGSKFSSTRFSKPSINFFYCRFKFWQPSKNLAFLGPWKLAKPSSKISMISPHFTDNFQFVQENVKCWTSQIEWAWKLWKQVISSIFATYRFQFMKKCCFPLRWLIVVSHYRNRHTSLP